MNIKSKTNNVSKKVLLNGYSQVLKLYKIKVNYFLTQQLSLLNLNKM